MMGIALDSLRSRCWILGGSLACPPRTVGNRCLISLRNKAWPKSTSYFWTMRPFFLDESNLGLDADINLCTSLVNADVKGALVGNSFAASTSISCWKPQRPQLLSLSHHGRACQGVYGTSHVDFSFSGGPLAMGDFG